MSTPSNGNTASPSPRNQAGPTSINTTHRIAGRDREVTSATALKAKARPTTESVPPSHQPGTALPNESGAR